MPRSRIAALAGVAGVAAIVIAAPGTATAGPPALTPDRIDAYLTEALDTTGLPGLSVAVTHDGEVVHTAGYGHDSTGAALTDESPMRVASLSKSFTAMAVMTLVDDEKITLDDPVAAQLPEFTMDDPRFESVTVRQLLNQTSGLSDTTIDIEAMESAGSLPEYIAGLETGGLASDPGTRFEYCNVNFDLAGRLVEVVSGDGFGDYLAEHVFNPLGMDGSAARASDITPADGYNSLFGWWVARPELDGFLDDSGAGGIITDAHDMARWLITQSGEGPQLVTHDSLETMHTSSPVNEYAMGWSVDTDGKLTHSGNLFTYNAVEMLNPDTGYGFAVMSNGAPLTDDTYTIAEGLDALSRGETPEGPGNDRQVIEAVLAGIALAAILVGVVAVRRSRGWARRRSGTAGWRIGLRLLPWLLPIGLFVAYPDLVSVISNGRTVTWAQLTYFAAPLSISLAAMAITAAVTIVVRLVRLRAAADHPTMPVDAEPAADRG